jgi:hypothetical protein
MEKILDGLNIGKELLDKTSLLISTLFGPSAKEIGEMFADNIRFSRLKNQMKILDKVVDLLEVNNLKPRELNLKTIVPLVEQSSLEEDELLQDKWANLITNICSTPETGLEPKLVKTFSQLSNMEAQVLDSVYDGFMKERKEYFNSYIDKSWFRYDNLDDIPLYWVAIRKETISKYFNIEKLFIDISIDNIVALGLMEYETPEINIEHEDTDVISDESGHHVGGLHVDLKSEAEYIQKDNYHLTTYGLYFLQQCRGINEK